MSVDARFEDGVERPLNLAAEQVEDLAVISALIQDAVFPVSEIAWQPGKRQFAVLLNRFRWEDPRPQGLPAERVRAVLRFGDVRKVISQGVARDDADLVFSVLSIAFEPGTDGTGRMVLTLAGDGQIALDVDCIDVVLKDVTRPYAAPSGKVPQHPE